jgi:DNA-binding transcriptional MerR regulator
VTTTELLNSLIDRAGTDGLPDLAEVLAASINLDAVPALPLAVGQVAELLGLSGHTLRYYERIGLVEVDRSGSGRRLYDREAIARVIFITRLRLSGMSIRDISDYIALVEQGDGTVDQRLRLLYRHRAKVRRQLDELTFAMAVIDYKITTYGGHCADR